ncbi:MAG: alpha/beta fold hydrolase [Pseudomonadota bacterium]
MIRTWADAQRGHLPEVDGHNVAWYVWGNPDAPALLMLHGGPGGGISETLAHIFDPAAWHLVAMDQRGCGRSTPHAGDTLAALAHNKTADLVADCERLRAALGLGPWVVFGGSWGATLAQALAHTHSGAVRGMVLAGVTTTRQAETDWLYGHLRHLMPEAFAAFQARHPGVAPGIDLVRAYGADLADPATCDGAAAAWAAWEMAAVSSDARHRSSARWQDGRFRLGFARLCAQYFSACAWLDPPLLSRAPALGDIPGELVNARFDLVSPPGTAWTLAQAWPGARLTLLPGGLHSAGEGAMAEAVRAAGARLAARLAEAPGAAL